MAGANAFVIVLGCYAEYINEDHVIPSPGGCLVARSKWKATVQVFPQHYRGTGDVGQLFEALSALANLRSDIKEYGKLRLKYPDIWPMQILSRDGEKLRWASEAFDLVRLYRDLLRSIWVWPCDPDDWSQLNRKREALRLLMGVVDFTRMLSEEHLPAGMPQGRFQTVWRRIRSHVPDATPGSFATVFPSWPSGQFVYMPRNRFQEGLYLLFRESWRARICGSCQAHFVAEKRQTQYCSSKCAAAAKRRNDLEWWHRKHGKRSN